MVGKERRQGHPMKPGKELHVRRNRWARIEILKLEIATSPGPLAAHGSTVTRFEEPFKETQ